MLKLSMSVLQNVTLTLLAKHINTKSHHHNLVQRQNFCYINFYPSKCMNISVRYMLGLLWYNVKKIFSYQSETFNTYRFNVALHWTLCCVVLGPMSSTSRHVILRCFMSLFLNFCHLMAVLLTQNIINWFWQDFWNLNLQNNLDFKGLMAGKSMYYAISPIVSAMSYDI